MNEYVTTLYHHLDDYYEQRKRLISFALVYLGIVITTILLFRVFMRRTGVMFFAILAAGVFALAVVGLHLLSRYIRNEVELRETERELDDYEIAHSTGVIVNGKRKRKKKHNTPRRFVVGDDGELIPPNEEEQSQRR